MGRASRRLRSRLAAGVMGVVVAAGLSQAPALGAPLPSGWTPSSSGIANIAEHPTTASDWVWTDALLDDYGATTASTPNNGDFTYPTDDARYAAACADIAEIRVRRNGANVDVLVRLNAMKVTDATVVGLAFDTTAGGGTAAWGKNSKLSTPGTEHVLMLWGTGGQWDGGALGGITTTIDTVTNTMTASIPATSAYLGSNPNHFGLFAAAGLWNVAQQKWLDVANGASTATTPGGRNSVSSASNAFNVAFRSGESGSYLTANQADALKSGVLWPSGSHTSASTSMRADVNLDVALPAPSGVGFLERTYYSTVAPGEGNSTIGVPQRGERDNNTGAAHGPLLLQNLGNEQPYKVYVPNHAPPYDRIGLFIHGGGGNFNSSIDQPGAQTQLGDNLNMVLVSCQARGPNSGGTDWAELDCLQALADARQKYGLPTQARAVVMGHSQGAGATLRFAVTRPDLFSAAIALAPEAGGSDLPDPTHTYAPEYIGPNGAPKALTENFRNVPFMDVHGEQDLNNPFADSQALIADLAGKGYMERFMDEPQADHKALVQDDYWAQHAQFIQDAAALDGPLSTPAHVTFKMSENWWASSISSQLVFDHAYWMSGLRVRTKSNPPSFLDKATVDVKTDGLAQGDPAVNVRPTQYFPTGPPQEYYLSGQDYSFGTVTTHNGFTAKLANVSAVTLDAGSMGLSPSGQIVADFTGSDGPSDVVLKGDFQDAVVSGAASDPGTSTGITLHVVLGTGTVTIGPDIVAPTTSLDSRTPSGPFTTSGSASFTFSGADPAPSSGTPTFECRLDGGSWGGCASPKAYAGLVDGAHLFEARAKDPAGNVDASPASAAWTVDSVAPSVAIGSHPAVAVSSASASFAFLASDPAPSSGFSQTCKLDGGAYAPCSSPQAYSALVDGSHTFSVKSTDGAGNSATDSFVWSVDTVAPDTSVLVRSPAVSPTTSTSATFTYSGTDPSPSSGTVAFECKLDGGSFASCPASGKTPSGLADGSHTVTVRAVDPAGNVDASPSASTWVVDTVAPTIAIAVPVSGGSYVKNTNRAASYSCTDTGGSGVASCAGTVANGANIDTSTVGSHSFTVTAVDNAGTSVSTTVVYDVHR